MNQPMQVADALDRGRESFKRDAWEQAYAELAAADLTAPLEPADLERLATTAHLLGRDAESVDLWTRAYNELVSRGSAQRAARCAFWVALTLMFKGQVAGGNGWISRAHRLLDDGRHDCVERGYLLFPVAIRSLVVGDGTTAYSTFSEAAGIGERFRDADLTTLGRLGQGRALIRMGETARGVGLLDEAMIAVTSGEVSPTIVGDVYCSAISGCNEIFDLGRAQEWTAALSRWCDSHPDHGPYRGHCLVHRAEIMQLHGAWPDAMDEAERAREWLSRPPPDAAAGAAFYQVGELRRLRGESAKAEEAYRQASELGREPQPGLARLRLAQGQIDAARTAIARAAGEARERRFRPPILAAYVDIMLAASETGSARSAAAELTQIATDVGAPLLYAVSAHATGAVLLAEDDALGALGPLRRALTVWREIAAPYEAAGTRVLIGLACQRLGDADSAAMELDGARHAYQQLGAAPDVARVKELARQSTRAAAGATGGLTAREREVLGLIATGKTNRAIADQLAISERTVARHVSNIFIKLGVSSRAAATAHAFQHRLVSRST